MRNLFQPPAGAFTADLAVAMRAILAATPLTGNHERDLPHAVRDLSRLLTQDRSQLAQTYWIGKRLLYAYCRYFLPWNLLRLSRLLPALEIPMRENGVILDLGSGPLTFPLALWLAKPEWRSLPLTFVCADVAPAPLAVGKEIFTRMAPGSPWTLEILRAPLEKALAVFGRDAHLITAGNVLNEMKPARDTPLEERLAGLVRRIAAKLAPGGRFLAVEPGTRLGGKLMAVTRLAAFSAHLVPEAPCPHWGPCPMLGSRVSGWCHFSHTAAGAPGELAALTAKAKLGKEHLSLSCMFLRKATDEEKHAALARMDAPDAWGGVNDTGDALFADGDAADGAYGIQEWAEAYARVRSDAEQNFTRILSDPIRLPDEPEAARYGCSVRGLVLVKNALRLPSGAAFPVRWPGGETRDAKTGALMITSPQREPKKNDPAPKARRARRDGLPERPARESPAPRPPKPARRQRDVPSGKRGSRKIPDGRGRP